MATDRYDVRDQYKDLKSLPDQPKRLGYSQDGDGTVTLRMAREDYDWIIFALGHLTGASPDHASQKVIALVNRLNAGNPNFTPYAVEPEPTH